MRPRNSRITKRARKRSKFRTILAYIQLTILLLCGAALGLGGAAVYGVWKVLPQNYNTSTYNPIEATRIYSADGIMLGSVYQENREVVPFNQIPKDLINATVAVEDKRFYKHVGVDLHGIARAVLTNVRGRKLTQGGSTLTQQLARNIYLTQRKTLSRKLQEAVLAIKIERTYSKDQILELYLNQVFYGSSAYGVETASKVYFGKSVKDLTLAQCALLAGLPQSPSTSSPYVNRDRAIRRRDLVLDRMHEMNYITAEQRDEAKAQPLRLAGRRTTRRMYKAGYFVDYVLKEMRDRYGEDAEDLIYKGGLRVYTTLNYAMQQEAERAVEEGVRNARWTGARQAALISIDPETGYIKAMVGGVDYGQSQFNRVGGLSGSPRQARPQPGSSFKIFVYTAVIDQKAYGERTGPYTTISNSRYTVPGTHYSPKNYNGHYGRSVSIRTAVAQSINVPAVRAGQEVGIRKIIEYARVLGVKVPLAPYPSLALGASGIPPIQMASAYGVIAAGGRRAEPISIVKVENSEGSVIETIQPRVRTVLSASTAETMDSLFRAVVTSGTGRSVRGIPEARGKTGTTNDSKSVWFIGYIPHKLVTAVWAGNDHATPMGRGAAGSTICGPIWKQFTEQALAIQKKWAESAVPQEQAEGNADGSREDERRRDRDERRRREREREAERNREGGSEPVPGEERIVRVRICSESQELATPNCPSTNMESFVSGFQPASRCSIHSGNPPSVEPAPERDSEGAGDSTGVSL